MVVYAGQGDQRRAMALLWRAHAPTSGSARGPKPALSVDEVVAAAIAVADEQGTLEALSMRAVAERLGCSPMALYTYVPGKVELVDLMVDQAHAGVAAEVDAAAGWRRALRAWAEALEARCLRHPWLLEVSHARPILGPHEQALLESLLTVLEAAGLGPRLRTAVTSALFSLVRGAAATAAQARAAAARTGRADRDWWAERAGGLDEVVPDWAVRFPASARLAAAAHSELDGSGLPLEQRARVALDDALEVLLDGIEAAVAGRR